nr:hypothetical protein [Clostridium botulinum]
MSKSNQFLLKINNESRNNLMYVYKMPLMEQIRNLFELFNNNRAVNVNFLNNHREVQIILGQYVPRWVRGFTINDDVYILIYSKEDYFNINEFEGILMHEIIHALVHRKVKECPIWLNEGLAMVLSNQYKGMKLDRFMNCNLDNVSCGHDFFYEKCCAKTIKYFSKYSQKEVITNLLDNKINFKNDVY